MSPSRSSDAASPRLCCGAGCVYDEGLVDDLVEQRDRARHLAKHLFRMIDRQAWRDTGGDDGQGHYEGDYHAAKIEEEIRSWES